MTKLAVFALMASLIVGAAHAAESAAPEGYIPLEQYGPADATTAAKLGVALYEAPRGASLRATLDKWASSAGWQPVVWKLPEETDFTLGASGRFEGDFVTASKALVNALGPEANLRVRFHHANRVLVVESM